VFNKLQSTIVALCLTFASVGVAQADITPPGGNAFRAASEAGLPERIAIAAVAIALSLGCLYFAKGSGRIVRGLVYSVAGIMILIGALILFRPEPRRAIQRHLIERYRSANRLYWDDESLPMSNFSVSY
jgi:hypothetical protein